MDDFGFSSALRTGLHIYESASRGSGRTTRLIASMNDGDYLLCATERMKTYMKGLARDSGKDIEVMCILGSPSETNGPDSIKVSRTKNLREVKHSLLNLRERVAPQGRRIFMDHELVRQLYEASVSGVSEFLSDLTAHQNDPRFGPEAAEPVLNRAHWGPEI